MGGVLRLAEQPPIVWSNNGWSLRVCNKKVVTYRPSHHSPMYWHREFSNKSPPIFKCFYHKSKSHQLHSSTASISTAHGPCMPLPERQPANTNTTHASSNHHHANLFRMPSGRRRTWPLRRSSLSKPQSPIRCC